jgi:hypothetical protein
MAKSLKLTFPPSFKVLILLTAFIYGCASMRSPEGGPIDRTPPKVLKMEPKDLTTNFNSQKIVITFDEYFKIVNEVKEFSVSPEQERAPVLKVDGKKLEITFQDSLEKNTTYTLNFGKAVADINESNALKNLTYAFSTGPLLDSLSISGKVSNLLTGKPEIDATVFIIPISRDSIFGKKKAPISTSTDSSGLYSLKNLKKDTYRIYALKETAGDKIYQQRTDEIGFIKDSIELTKNITNLDIGVFKELAQDFRIVDRKFNSDGSMSMIFNQQLVKPEITILDQKSIDESKLVRFNKTKDSLSIWLQDLTFDSVNVEIKAAGKPLDTVTFKRDQKDTYIRSLQISDNLDVGALNPYRPYKILFNLPIEKVDLSKIKLTEDSIPRTNFTFVKDTINLLAYNFKYPWRKKASYVITLGEGAVSGIFAVKNKEFKKSFKLISTDEYGSFVLKVEIPDTTKTYVLEILNDQKAVIATEVITKNRSIKFANYKVATYFTRIIYDENKNGKWDTGNLALRTQPELTFNNPQEIVLKANWEQVFTWAIPLPQKADAPISKEKDSTTNQPAKP